MIERTCTTYIKIHVIAVNLVYKNCLKTNIYYAIGKQRKPGIKIYIICYISYINRLQTSTLGLYLSNVRSNCPYWMLSKLARRLKTCDWSSDLGLKEFNIFRQAIFEPLVSGLNAFISVGKVSFSLWMIQTCKNSCHNFKCSKFVCTRATIDLAEKRYQEKYMSLGWTSRVKI